MIMIDSPFFCRSYIFLRRTQNTLGTDQPDWEAWLMFFLRYLVKQKDALAKKIAIDGFPAPDLHPAASWAFCCCIWWMLQARVFDPTIVGSDMPRR
jgi:hypothetical protein